MRYVSAGEKPSRAHGNFVGVHEPNLIPTATNNPAVARDSTGLCAIRCAARGEVPRNTTPAASPSLVTALVGTSDAGGVPGYRFFYEKNRLLASNIYM